MRMTWMRINLKYLHLHLTSNITQMSCLHAELLFSVSLYLCFNMIHIQEILEKMQHALPMNKFSKIRAPMIRD